MIELLRLKKEILLNYSRYERFGILILFIVILILFEIIFIINIMREENEIYISFSGVVMKNNIGLFIINDKDMKILYKNKYLYFNGKRIKYSIEKITKDVIKKDNNKYNEVLLRFKLSKKKYKDNDVIDISIRRDKESIIKMFKIIWRGDKSWK